MRWMDDVVCVWDTSIKRGTWRVLKYLQRPNAYGETLMLVRTHGGDAFGFRWSTDGGILKVEQEPKWVCDFKSHSTVTKGSRVFQGNQFTSAKTRKGVLLGYILRWLDCTNASEAEVQLSLMRRLAELRFAEHRVEWIIETGRQAEKQALTTIPMSVLGWSHDQIRQFRLVFDTNFRMRCNVQETCLLLQERNDAAT